MMFLVTVNESEHSNNLWYCPRLTSTHIPSRFDGYTAASGAVPLSDPVAYFKVLERRE